MTTTADARIALVTGATQGIGFEVCRQLARRDLRIVLTGRPRAGVDSVVATLRQEGLDVISAGMDVTADDSVRACARDIAARVGGVDVLVNNAAVLVPSTPSS